MICYKLCYYVNYFSSTTKSATNLPDFTHCVLQSNVGVKTAGSGLKRSGVSMRKHDLNTRKISAQC